jgi:Phage integrase family
VRSLAWPAAVVIIACLFFREQLREVIRKLAERIPYLKTINVGKAAATFGDELAGVKVDLAQIITADTALVVSARRRAPHTDDERELERRRAGTARRRYFLTDQAPRLRVSSGAPITSRYGLQFMTILGVADDAAPAVTVLSVWSCLESLLREIAQLSGIRDTCSFTLLADEVITELGKRDALPAPDRTRSVVQRLLSLKRPVERGAAVRPRYQTTRKEGPHQLRHYYASVMLHGGVPIKELAEYLGHHDPAFTLRVYSHLISGSHERARQVFDSRLFWPRAVADGT